MIDIPVKTFAISLALLMACTPSLQADYLDAEGEAPYEQCGYCHEIDGNPRMTRYPRLAGQHPAYLVKQLKDFRSGERKGEMQATAELLSDSAIEIVADYFSRQAIKLATLDAQSTEGRKLAKRLYKQGDSSRGLLACASCHGAQAIGTAGIPRLATQHEDYLLQQLNQFKNGTRHNDKDGQMRVMTDLLTEAEIGALAAWLARLGRDGSDRS